MATQGISSSALPLIAGTLLTSICAIAAGETRAFELLAQTANQPVDFRASGPRYDGSPSADAVAEARWGQSHDDYVLDETGQIVSERSAPGELLPVERADRGETSENNHFDGSSRLDGVTGEPECGPSPATPAEITSLVVEAAQRHKVDVGFAVAITMVESRLDRLRNSPAGARGPMQLMAETAERFGVTDICDPLDNIDGGVRYLRELADEFHNPLLVAAAYNAGEGRVREHGGIPPFKETLSYVAQVLNTQMGLGESDPVALEQGDSAGEQQRSSDVSGVITTRERRQWVGGVMHF